MEIIVAFSDIVNSSCSVHPELIRIKKMNIIVIFASFINKWIISLV
jgi:hypothetical protein